MGWSLPQIWPISLREPLTHLSDRSCAAYRCPPSSPRSAAAADGGCRRPAPGRAGRGPLERRPEGRGTL
jgi:hypothetical protein